MIAALPLFFLLKYGFISIVTLVTLYICLLGLLATPFIQAHVVYLHAFQMTWFKDLNVPEMFGFLHNQAIPFSIRTADNETLHAWHILPIELYRKHEQALLAEPSGFSENITSSLAFRLLHDDPDARLVLHMHGAGGTVGSGYRVPNYRALSAGHPSKIHVLTFDYRGFGRSSGTPSERGMLLDALAVVDWATQVARVPPNQIVIFGQSMGTAVSLGLMEHFALQSPPVVFAGTVLVASFVDVPTLVATYRVAGSIPILSPLTRFPRLFKYLGTFIRDKWLSKDRVANYVRANELNGEKYQLTLIHAEDDYDIPFDHTPALFKHAVNATVSGGITDNEYGEWKNTTKEDLGATGSVIEWRTENGLIREELMKFGLHDVIMGNSIIAVAVMRIFDVSERL